MEETQPSATPQPPSSPQPQAPQSAGIDLRTLAKFIAVIGIVVACYGAYRVSESMDLPPPPSDSGEFKGWRHFLDTATDSTKNPMGVALINQDRARARADAYKIIAVGAVIAFVAIGIDRSVKRPR